MNLAMETHNHENYFCVHCQSFLHLWRHLEVVLSTRSLPSSCSCKVLFSKCLDTFVNIDLSAHLLLELFISSPLLIWCNASNRFGRQHFRVFTVDTIVLLHNLPSHFTAWASISHDLYVSTVQSQNLWCTFSITVSNCNWKWMCYIYFTLNKIGTSTSSGFSMIGDAVF